jgi:hypothetical protein
MKPYWHPLGTGISWLPIDLWDFGVFLEGCHNTGGKLLPFKYFQAVATENGNFRQFITRQNSVTFQHS